MKNKSDFIKIALDAVEKAENVVMKYYNSLRQDEIDIKPDASPVTIADREAQAIIVETIKSQFPGHKFLGEEDSVEESGEYVWVIDPIDGTKNFIRQIPLFGIELALLHKGEIILGVSDMPLMNELLYAEKGNGAFLKDKPISVSNIDKLEDSYMSFGSHISFRNNKLEERFDDLDSNVRWSRGIGDAYSYHLLAQGRIEIVIEAGTKIWDIAALKIIVEEAGGTVSDFEGNPITQKSTQCIATNGKIHDEVTEIFCE